MDKDRMDNDPLQDVETKENDTLGGKKQSNGDLYQDLPKEVVDILRQTHPLLTKEESLQETNVSRTKRMSKEEREEVRADRRKTLEEERKKQEEYIPRNQRQQSVEIQEKSVLQEAEEIENKQGWNKVSEQEELKGDWIDISKQDAPIFQDPIIMTAMQAEDEDEKVQFVKIKMPNKNKRKSPEVKGKSKKKRWKKADADIYPEEDLVDFGTKEKEEHLDQLYQEYDENDEEEYFSGKNLGEKKGYIIIGVVAFLMIILTIRSITLGSKLKKAEEELVKQVDISQKYEELQLENLSLQEKIKILNGEDVPTMEEFEEDTEKPKTDDGKQKTTMSKTVKYDKYMTKENDTFWDISEKLYGNGAYYTKILEANGMSENDYIQPGKALKIPKLAQ